MNKKKVIAIVVIVVAIVVAVLALRGCSASSGAGVDQEEEKYVPVEVSAAAKQTLAQTVSLNGKVYADNEVMVVPKTPGKVTSVHVQVGDKVAKGSVLFVLDPGDVQKQVDQAKAALEAAQANYERTKEQVELAKKNLERQRALYEAGAISKAELEQAELQASDTALAAVEAQVKQAEAGYQQAVSMLNDMTVTAPISGYVSAVNVQVGGMATNAQPAVTIVAMDQVYVEISVAENIVNALKVGQEVEVNISSAGDAPFKGTISAISPAADARTQLYPVKIYLDNAQGLIKPGMFARVTLATKVKADVLAVPSAAVVKYRGQDVVYVVNGDKAVQKAVKVGMDTGTLVEIVEGLTEGDQVIVKGQDYVLDGSTVKVVGGNEA